MHASRVLFASLSCCAFFLACGGATESASDKTGGGLTASNPAGSGTSTSPAPTSTTGTSPSPTSTSTATPPPGPDPIPTPVKPDASLAVIQARCQDATHGPVDVYNSYSELKPKLAGRWFACDRTTPGFYTREDGIELTFSSWHSLHLAADGHFDDLQGIENTGTWGEKYTDFIGYFQVNWADGQNQMVLSQIDFETSPTRMRMTDTIANVSTWFVPMGQ